MHAGCSTLAFCIVSVAVRRAHCVGRSAGLVCGSIRASSVNMLRPSTHDAQRRVPAAAVKCQGPKRALQAATARAERAAPPTIAAAMSAASKQTTTRTNRARAGGRAVGSQASATRSLRGAPSTRAGAGRTGRGARASAVQWAASSSPFTPILTNGLIAPHDSPTSLAALWAVRGRIRRADAVGWVGSAAPRAPPPVAPGRFERLRRRGAPRVRNALSFAGSA